ncbi:hypothetical protein BHAOGJBA_4025 [Methylobacterium hispanicum]|uniref:Glycosyltransferase 2-like domain-containing protein n=1 Tax=Methylobacterium hispanicum TaxID=270350 RepID=A0AAV4ZPH1_9HYPH|nr:hypothetical protein BHAOGJBA_4025 [Methylobacterium hispanicum]
MSSSGRRPAPARAADAAEPGLRVGLTIKGLRAALRRIATGQGSLGPFGGTPDFAGRVAGITGARCENLTVSGRGRVVLAPGARIGFGIKPYLAASALSVQVVLDIEAETVNGPPWLAVDYGAGFAPEHTVPLRRPDAGTRWTLHVPLPQFVRGLRLEFHNQIVGPATIHACLVQRSDLRDLLDHLFRLPAPERQRLTGAKVAGVLAALEDRRDAVAEDAAAERPQSALAAAIGCGLLADHAQSAPSDPRYVGVVERDDRLGEADRAWMDGRMAAFAERPLLSVVMPVYDPPLDLLEEAIRSLQRQTYPHWELCLADDASRDFAVRDVVRRLAAEDPRIRPVFRETNGHISQASNAAAALARGRFLVLMDNDDLLPDHALWTVADAIDRHPGCRMLFSDEDKINLEGRRAQPYRKGAFDRFLMYGHNMFSHLGVYERALFEAVGGFRVGYEGSQDYDLALRCMERCAEAEIVHIPHVLYRWRQLPGSTALGGGQKSYAFAAAKRAIDSHFERMGYPLESIDGPGPGIAAVRTLGVADPKRISVVIPTRNGLDLLRPCIESLLAVGDPLVEIVVVDNFSDDPGTLAYLDGLRRDRARITVVRSETAFNFPHLCNLGVARARGEIVCLLNNDTEVLSQDLFQRARAFLSIPDVGAVGARLLYPHGAVQHFGVYTGVGPYGIATHAHAGRADDAHVQFSKSVLLQQFVAVTAACCFLRKADYEAVGGMDEAFAVAYNDVDLCLKLRQRGLKVICDPGIRLVHKESVSRGRDVDPTKVVRLRREAELMEARWGREGLRDPFYNPAFSARSGDFELAEFPRVAIPWKDPAGLAEVRPEAPPEIEVAYEPASEGRAGL